MRKSHSMAKANPRKSIDLLPVYTSHSFIPCGDLKERSQLTEKQTSISFYLFIVYGYKNQLILNTAISLSVL